MGFELTVNVVVSYLLSLCIARIPSNRNINSSAFLR
jgi:hypothetical protein